MRNTNQPMDLSWASERWSDPETGTEVVRLSPEGNRHFRNAYFRVNMFTPDGRYAVIMSLQGEEKGPGSLWRIDTATGATEEVGRYAALTLGNWAVSTTSNCLHVTEEVEGRSEVEIIDLVSGRRNRVRTSGTVETLKGAVASADDRHIYSAWCERKQSESMSRTEYIAMMGSAPGPNIMYRIDLENGRNEEVFACQDWWMGHPNPNPVNPDLFMCCQEGWIWTEDYPRPADFHRIRVYDLANGNWLDLSERRIHASHEMWSADGQRIYGHSRYCGHHKIGRFDLDQGRWTTWVMK
ncbi:MAG: TolB-like translocation protein, partial [Planctomycetota bacterium]